MSLADIVRTAVSIAESITKSGELQESFTLQRWNGDDSYGKPTYAAALTLDGIVDHSARRIRTDAGAETIATATITVLKPFKKLTPTVTGREEPVDKRDKITLASGKSGPILLTNTGLADPDTERPYVVQILLG